MTPTDASAPIWQVDWSQFIPDVISGLLTSVVVGVGVGIFLWKFQSKSEKKTLERIAFLSWTTVRSRVAIALTQPFKRFVNSNGLPSIVVQLRPLLEEGRSLESLGAWVEAAPELDELYYMANLMEYGPTLQRITTELHGALQNAFVDEGFVAAGYAENHVVIASAMVLGLDPPEARPGFAESYNDAARTVLARPDIAQLVTNFNFYLGEVETNYELLRDTLHGKLS